MEVIDFETKGDERGNLISLEQNKNIPFDIKRVYYIFGTKGDVRRGFHAHKNLKQVLVCISGGCKIMLDDGKAKEEILLNSPNRGLLLKRIIWREMYDFSPNCILMVLANEVYNEKDYITNYKEFLELAR